MARNRHHAREKVDGRSSALRALSAGEDRLLAAASVAYFARSPDYASGMTEGYRYAKAVLWESRSAWRYIAALIPDDPDAA